MKYIKYFFLSVIVIFIIYTLFSLTSTKYRNFRITDISIRPINIYGSENLKQNRRYYILEFITVRCNPYKVFMEAPTKYTESIVEDIKKITICDSTQDISNKFKGWNCENINMSKNNCDPNPQKYDSFIDLNEMINAINYNNKDGLQYENRHRISVYLKNSVLFYTESDKVLPKSIKITFPTYTIEKKEIEPVVKDTLYIYSKDFADMFYKGN